MKLARMRQGLVWNLHLQLLCAECRQAKSVGKFVCIEALQPLLAHPRRCSRWRKGPLAVLEIREAIQDGKRKGIQRSSIIRVPFLQNSWWRLGHFQTSRSRNSRMKMLRELS